MDMQTIGVVGCGLMGAGIVEVAARSGFDVIVSEANEDFLQSGLARIDKSLARAVKKGKLSEEDAQAIKARMTGVVGLDAFKDVDLVIEAVSENIDLKRDIFSKLDEITRPDVILASNTSSISIAALAAATKRPDKVVGMHFFNPVPVMALLELVKGILTSDETLATVRSVGERMGKTPVVAKDSPGFIVNRLLIPFLLDAIRMYESGLATKEDIDTGVKLGLNHPMGPLTLADFVGLDTTLFVADVLYEEYGDPNFKAPPLLRQMVAAGLLGRKSGQGFYDWRR
ncbi:MAG TPA: 3-hydroxybutyryl-CoA dehydrogenase [Anaerolineae bacterium]|nr:3-hydroxybutyryl-CoA dehydrogenase [Anaerolineae bacterium]